MSSTKKAANTGTSLIRTAKLKAFYEKDAFLLDVGDLSICVGEKLAVLGSSGAGKTTFLSIFANTPNLNVSGQVNFLKNDYFECVKDVLSLVYLDHTTDNKTTTSEIGMTVKDHLKVVLGSKNPTYEKKVLDYISMVGKELRIDGLENRTLKTLSGGEKRLIDVLLVKSFKFDLVLLDEPTKHLGLLAKNRYIESISAYKGTTIMATNDLEFVSSIATRCLFLLDGLVVSDGGTELLDDKELLGRVKIG